MKAEDVFMGVGTVLEKVSKDDYDHRIVATCGELVAIQPIKEHVYKSYAGVIAGLSPNPISVPVVEPVYWYVLAELMTVFRVKTGAK